MQKFRSSLLSNDHVDRIYPPEVFNHVVSVECEASRNQKYQQIKNHFFLPVFSQDGAGDDGEKRENRYQIPDLLSGGGPEQKHQNTVDPHDFQNHRRFADSDGKRQHSDENRADHPVKVRTVHFRVKTQIPGQQDIIEKSPAHAQTLNKKIIELSLLRLPPPASEDAVKKGIEGIARHDPVFDIERAPDNYCNEAVKEQQAECPAKSETVLAGRPENAEQSDKRQKKRRVFAGQRQARKDAAQDQPSLFGAIEPVDKRKNSGHRIERHKEIIIGHVRYCKDGRDRTENQKAERRIIIAFHPVSDKLVHSRENEKEHEKMHPPGQDIPLQKQSDQIQHFAVQGIIRKDISRDEIEPVMLEEQLGHGKVIDEGILADFRCQGKKEAGKEAKEQ